MLAYNLLRLLEIEALPGEMQTSRTNRLRFHLFNVAGQVVKSAGRLLLRMAVSAMELSRLCAARRAIARMTEPAG